MEAGDGEPCGSKDANVVDVFEAMDAPENGHVEIRPLPPPSKATG